jgi:hypothetical protein
LMCLVVGSLVGKFWFLGCRFVKKKGVSVRATLSKAGQQGHVCHLSGD